MHSHIRHTEMCTHTSLKIKSEMKLSPLGQLQYKYCGRKLSQKHAFSDRRPQSVIKMEMVTGTAKLTGKAKLNP